MPLRPLDPYANRADRFDSGVNPYVALLTNAAKDGSLPVAFGEGLRGAAGGWRQRLAEHSGASAPQSLILEIGCHKGETLLAMATDTPEAGFVGLDITFKRVVTTAQRVKRAKLGNVHLAMANASALDAFFAPQELNGVIIFFPDPWTRKARQAKNRLINSNFVARLAQALAPGGFLWLKTDQASYFEEAAAAIDGSGSFEKTSLAVPELFTKDYDSCFARHFREQGIGASAGIWRRLTDEPLERPDLPGKITPLVPDSRVLY